MPIPGVVAGAPFCPYCGASKGAPQQVVGGAQVQARVEAIRLARSGQQAAKAARPFSTSFPGLCFTFDPRAGYALIGAYAPDGQPPRLRAYDLMGGRVAWEAFTGDEGVLELDYESITVRAGNVYVGVGRSFRVVDLFTGQQKWGAELPDALAYDGGHFTERGPRVIDPVQPGMRGPVWVIAVDKTVAAFDRDTGQPCGARSSRTRRAGSTRSSPGCCSPSAATSSSSWIPSNRHVIERVGPRVERLDIEGRQGIMQVDRFGWRDREGILVHDFVARKELLFEGVDDLEDDVQSVTGQGRVFCAVESGAKLVAAPRGKPVELMAGMHIRALAMCGPTLMVLLVKHQGTRYRRLLGVDAQSLAVRFDLGEWTTSPTDHWTRQVCSNGHIAVVVTSTTDRDDNCELVAVNPAGRIGWKLAVGEWKAHAFVGGHLVVCSSKGWQVVRPDTGQVVASYAGGDDY